jgi:hypothetical protein
VLASEAVGEVQAGSEVELVDNEAVDLGIILHESPQTKSMHI